MGAADNAPVLTIRSRADLRDWLAANHACAPTVWLASYKRAHPDYVAYEAIVEELLCWGWIDSVTRALDLAITALRSRSRTRLLILAA